MSRISRLELARSLEFNSRAGDAAQGREQQDSEEFFHSLERGEAAMGMVLAGQKEFEASSQDPAAQFEYVKAIQRGADKLRR